ncbi:MAG: TIGR00725 family protein [Candidatus Omnitrophica bacterium]|nr:TIGR00725 family protein [Candidatus Omnitrophota bacterium]
MTRMRKKIIGVIGGHKCNNEVEQLAHNLGKKIAKVADILVSGGLSGTMMAVCQGFKAGGGLTLGIIPGYNKCDANQFVDIVIPTGLGLARNILVVKSADVVIALPGESGTLSEIAYCLQFGIPVISLKSWDIPGVIKVNTVKAAVSKACDLLKKPVSPELKTKKQARPWMKEKK